MSQSNLSFLWPFSKKQSAKEYKVPDMHDLARKAMLALKAENVMIIKDADKYVFTQDKLKEQVKKNIAVMHEMLSDEQKGSYSAKRKQKFDVHFANGEEFIAAVNKKTAKKIGNPNYTVSEGSRRAILAMYNEDAQPELWTTDYHTRPYDSIADSNFTSQTNTMLSQAAFQLGHQQEAYHAEIANTLVLRQELLRLEPAYKAELAKRAKQAPTEEISQQALIEAKIIPLVVTKNNTDRLEKKALAPSVEIKEIADELETPAIVVVQPKTEMPIIESAIEVKSPVAEEPLVQNKKSGFKKLMATAAIAAAVIIAGVFSLRNQSKTATKPVERAVVKTQVSTAPIKKTEFKAATKEIVLNPIENAGEIPALKSVRPHYRSTHSITYLKNKMALTASADTARKLQPMIPAPSVVTLTSRQNIDTTAAPRLVPIRLNSEMTKPIPVSDMDSQSQQVKDGFKGTFNRNATQMATPSRDLVNKSMVQTLGYTF